MHVDAAIWSCPNQFVGSVRLELDSFHVKKLLIAFDGHSMQFRNQVIC